MTPASNNGQEALARRRVVLDTSLFVNPDVRAAFGPTPTEALKEFLSLAKQTPSLEFYMPPSIFTELQNFIEPEDITGDLLAHLRQKPPKKHELMVPGFLLYELIEEMRERVYKGLRVAEKAVRSTSTLEVDAIIKDMRRKYRDALREGIIDSREDVDLILLAMELDALLVTADQGAIKWADKLGVQWLIPEKFKDFVLACADKEKAPSLKSEE